MLLLSLFVCVCVFFLSKMQQCIYVKPNYVESYSPEQNTEGKRALYWKNGCVQTSQKLDGLALKIYGSLRSSADQDVKRRCRHMNVAICDKNRIEDSCCFLNSELATSLERHLTVSEVMLEGFFCLFVYLFFPPGFLWDCIWISTETWKILNLGLVCLKTFWEQLIGLAGAVFILF